MRILNVLSVCILAIALTFLGACGGKSGDGGNGAPPPPQIQPLPPGAIPPGGQDPRMQGAYWANLPGCAQPQASFQHLREFCEFLSNEQLHQGCALQTRQMLFMKACMQYSQSFNFCVGAEFRAGFHAYFTPWSYRDNRSCGSSSSCRRPPQRDDRPIEEPYRYERPEEFVPYDVRPSRPQPPVVRPQPPRPQPVRPQPAPVRPAPVTPPKKHKVDQVPPRDCLDIAEIFKTIRSCTDVPSYASGITNLELDRVTGTNGVSLEMKKYAIEQLYTNSHSFLLVDSLEKRSELPVVTQNGKTSMQYDGIVGKEITFCDSHRLDATVKDRSGHAAGGLRFQYSSVGINELIIVRSGTLVHPSTREAVHFTLTELINFGKGIDVGTDDFAPEQSLKTLLQETGTRARGLR